MLQTSLTKFIWDIPFESTSPMFTEPIRKQGNRNYKECISLTRRKELNDYCVMNILLQYCYNQLLQKGFFKINLQC